MQNVQDVGNVRMQTIKKMRIEDAQLHTVDPVHLVSSICTHLHAFAINVRTCNYHGTRQ